MVDEMEMIRREAERGYEMARDDASTRIKNQMTFADAALKALLLTNGGAMVALFTFIGNVVGKGGSSAAFNAPSLWWAFACFVAGLVLGLVGHLFAFLSQGSFYLQSLEEAWRHQRSVISGAREPLSAGEIAAHNKGERAFTLGIAIAVFSMTMFATGCGFALAGVLLR